MVAEVDAEVTTSQLQNTTAHPLNRLIAIKKEGRAIVRRVREYGAFELGPLTFIVIPALLGCVLAWGTAVAWRRTGAPANAARRASVISLLAASAWMAVTWIAAASGVLRQWDRTPPPFGLFVVSIVVLAFVMTYSRFGARIASGIPIWTLVLVQAFRFPLELAMHGMYTRSIMPVQMTYTGLNFDIVTGISAIPVALLAAGGGGSRMVMAGTILGLVLLINVVTVAILGTPRFRYFGEEHLNVWVTYPPFVWLPAVMVLAALSGHLLVFRALRYQRRVCANRSRRVQS